MSQSHGTAWRAGRQAECQLCVENAKGRGNHVGHYLYRPSRPQEIVEMASYLHKPTAKGVPMDGQVLLDEDRFPSEVAALGEFVWAETWPDGSDRTPGTIVVFREAGKIKMCLNDKDAGTLAFVSASTWPQLVEWAEQGLRDQLLDWRPARDRRR